MSGTVIHTLNLFNNPTRAGIIMMHILMIVNRESERLSKLPKVIPLYSFSRAAITKHRWLKQWKCIVLQSWRLQVQNQCISRVGFFFLLKAVSDKSVPDMSLCPNFPF